MLKINPKIQLAIFLCLAFIPNTHAQCDSLALASETTTGQDQVNALNDYARCFFGSDFEKMDSISKAAFHLAKDQSYFSGMARSKQNTGLVLYYFVGEREKALLDYENALRLYRQAGDSIGVAKALGDIGSYYHYNKEIGKALPIYIQGLKICEDENYDRGISAFTNNIGSVYSLTNQFDQSLIYFKKGLNYIDEKSDPRNFAIQTENIGNSFSGLNQFDSAETYINRALVIYKKLSDPIMISASYLNLYDLYTGVNSKNHPDWKKKKIIVDSAYFYADKCTRMENKLRAFYLKGSISEIEGNITAAKNYYNAALALKNPESPPNLVFVEANYKLGLINGQAGSYKSAFEYLKEAFTEKIVLDSLTYSETVEEMKMIYQVDEAKKEVELIQKDKALSDLQLEIANNENAKKDILAKKKQLQIYAVSGALILSFFLAIVAFKAYRNKRKSNAIILDQKYKVENQKAEIEEQHKEIKDSMEYAKRIQTAILPPNKLVKQYLEESFILYKPKDIVAGDFYWMEHKAGKVLFAAADCTGHGVPGAMVSVICNGALNRSVREFGLTDPGKILGKAREIVIQEFEKSEEVVKDGMDIALCSLAGNKLEYAGAHNPLWIIRNGEIIETKANKQPIGKFENPLPYTTHTFDLEKGDTFYIFSDGFVDQFGGEKGKKFKAKAFKVLLLSIQNESLEKQRELIDSAFKTWRGNLEQVDDVCVIGVRIN